MVATRALQQTLRSSDTETQLRGCVRDLVAMSSLPAIWIRADRLQIADSLAQLVISILDAEFACVILGEPRLEIAHSHDRAGRRPLQISLWRDRYRPDARFEVEDPHHGCLRAMCVPIGRDPGSLLVAFSKRCDFPLDSEVMLLRVAANQAAVALQRWAVEQRFVQQTRTLAELNQTTEALYKFTDRLFRSQSQGDMHEAALDAILATLRCQRASILLFDDLGVMRFVAWRGLSETYRHAVNGHSPWTQEDREAAPVCIDQIALADMPDELKSTVAAEGISALAFIPIIAKGRVTGKFMAYYDLPHRFDESEIDAAVTLARQLGFGLERWRAEQARELLVGELSHRVKNTLATVISIARQSFSNASSIDGARRSLEGRILALAQTHSQLADTNWSGVSLEKLVHEELAPYRSEIGSNVQIQGPPVALNAKGAVLLGMAFHELATNAAKYGALSVRSGAVDVDWRLDRNGITVQWHERNGPPVRAPERTGFGRLLLERALVSDLCGTVKLDFAQAGLKCTIALPPEICAVYQ